MATRTTVLRNTGVFTQATEQGKSVRFTYTDGQGVTKRRTVKPFAAEKTRHNKDALLVKGTEGAGNVRSFRTDRVMRAVLVG
jgi:predicted DNA-binding transcriptional regulator YafY